MRRYNSFLLRHWQLSTVVERIEVKHVQTDRHALLTSLDEAARWIAAVTREGAFETMESTSDGDDRTESNGRGED